ncbi:gluconokinase [Pseudorhodoferax sp.]|uniref:gluconokinase n=1 Tax=Pseudorhodoferax sp. TaxID=1993553 RepID=UPI0039E4E6A2
MQGGLVVMGVAGCGKSSLGAAVAAAQGAVLVEGDEFHSAANRDKMHRGVPLTDADRAGWLDELGRQLAMHGARGVVLTCSALRRSYRDRLRQALPGLRFAYLELTPAESLARVQGRGDTHFFSASLVDSQFATLEPPTGEAGVLRLDATEPLEVLARCVGEWLGTTP